VWDLGLVDEENGAGAFDAVNQWWFGTSTVGEQLAPSISKASFPGLCAGAGLELCERPLLATSAWWHGC
jgi:hypothetical protein